MNLPSIILVKLIHGLRVQTDSTLRLNILFQLEVYCFFHNSRLLVRFVFWAHFVLSETSSRLLPTLIRTITVKQTLFMFMKKLIDFKQSLALLLTSYLFQTTVDLKTNFLKFRMIHFHYFISTGVLLSVIK